MRTVETKLYKFEELSEEAQQKTLEALYDINVMGDWWNSSYEDAKNSGIKITGFDIERGNYCNIELIEGAQETARKIIADHGETCDTHEISVEFMKDYDNLVYKYSDKVNTEKVAEDNEADFDNDADDLSIEYVSDLSQCYLKLLRDEYEHLTSEEAVKEGIISNEYEFEEEGGDIY